MQHFWGNMALLREVRAQRAELESGHLRPTTRRERETGPRRKD
jgi:hypothetical protein